MMRKWLHWLVGHTWKYSPAGMRRYCITCGKREVLVFRSQYMTTWLKHTYPLDADPTKDPTPICIDDFPTTIGEQITFEREVVSQSPRFVQGHVE